MRKDRPPCSGKHDVFFSPGAEAKDARLQREAKAKAYCGVCPLRERCLEGAMARREPDGIWGGLTTDERKQLRRAIRAS